MEHSEVCCSGDRIRFTVSVGVVTGMHRSLDALIREADRLLYSAKRHGRNRVAAETPGRPETRSPA